MSSGKVVQPETLGERPNVLLTEDGRAVGVDRDDVGQGHADAGLAVGEYDRRVPDILERDCPWMRAGMGQPFVLPPQHEYEVGGEVLVLGADLVDVDDIDPELHAWGLLAGLRILQRGGVRGHGLVGGARDRQQEEYTARHGEAAVGHGGSLSGVSAAPVGPVRCGGRQPDAGSGACPSTVPHAGHSGNGLSRAYGVAKIRSAFSRKNVSMPGRNADMSIIPFPSAAVAFTP